MRHIPLPLSKGLMARSGLEPSFLRVDVEFGSGTIQVNGLQYARHLIVRGWFLKWNCFLIVWVRRVTNFCMRWSVEAEGVGTKLRPKVSTLFSIGDS